MSPPWGGVEYQNPSQMADHPLDVDTSKYCDIYPLSELRPGGGRNVFRLAQTISPRTVLFLPRNSDLNDIAQLREEIDTPIRIHIEECWLGYKLKALAIYFFPDLQGFDMDMSRFWPGNRPLHPVNGITRDTSKAAHGGTAR